MGKRVLVIAAHPDDELLGCGATIAKHSSKGDEVKAIIMCEGETMRNQDSSLKRKCSLEASKILGVSEIIMIGYPDQHLDTLPLVDVITPIEKIVQEFKPNIIYVHHSGDLNKDHQVVFEATMVASRPKNSFIEGIYSYYVVGSSEWNFPRAFNPDVWVEISEEFLDKKLKSFSCYETELCEYPNPRSLEAIKNLALYNGNQCCMEYAECFETIRKIIR